MIEIKTNDSRFKTMSVCYRTELKSALAEGLTKIGTSVQFKNSTADLEFEYDIEFNCANSFTIFAGDEFVGIGDVYLTPDMVRQSNVKIVDSYI